MRGNGQCIANLLVDTATGGILHASLTARFFCGYSPERLRKMNVADLFHQTVQEILGKLKGSDYLKVITLDAKLSSGETRSTRAYASHSPERADTLFLSVYELAG